MMSPNCNGRANIPILLNQGKEGQTVLQEMIKDHLRLMISTATIHNRSICLTRRTGLNGLINNAAKDTLANLRMISKDAATCSLSNLQMVNSPINVCTGTDKKCMTGNVDGLLKYATTETNISTQMKNNKNTHG